MSGIAEIHKATLSPTKLEMVAAWLPSQPWFTGDASTAQIVSAFRFVDPDGKVGMETQLVRVGDVTYQVPLTYRDAPLDEAADHFMGTMEHSTLGTRYVYDAPGDPVYVAEMVRVIREGDNEAARSDGAPTAKVLGSGVVAGVDLMGRVRVTRAIGADPQFSTDGARGVLECRWTEGDVERNEIVATLH